MDRVRAAQSNIGAVVQRTAAACGASADVTWTQVYPGYEVAREEICTLLFSAGCHKLSIEPDYLVTDGGGDANPLNGAGIICVPFGLGMQAIHTNEEFIRLSDLHSAFLLLLECVAAR
jgi:tripeptide aminopeptidase